MRTRFQTISRQSNAINGLKNKTSIGPDVLLARFLKKCVKSISNLEWCVHNRLVLNCDNCKVLSFGRSKKNRLSYKYTLKGIKLEAIERIKDLGVIFDEKFIFDELISMVSNKALSTLSFIERSTKIFTDTHSIISLYKSLV